MTDDLPIRPVIGALQLGLRGRDVRLGLLERGDGVLVLLLADGIDRDEFRRSARIEACSVQRGLGTRERGLRACMLGAVGRIVELVKRLAGLDRGALRVQAFLDDAVHLRPHLGNEKRDGAPRQFAGQRDGLRRQGHDGDGDGAGTLWRYLLAAAGGDEARGCQ